jgi:antirestriction protein ArdC
MRDIYKAVTEQIITELKSGTRPWVKPWSQTPGLNIPANAVTGRPYSGVNTLLLWTTRHKGWPQPRFLTFKQALETGGHVRKGEHGQHVVFVKDLRIREAEEDNPHIIRMLRTYTVFNIAQCDELPDRLTTPPEAPNLDRRDELIDEFIAATGARIWGGATEIMPYYDQARDFINMPALKLFYDRAKYYATLFHELIHWTKRESRLNRQLGARFGLKTRAAEELIAELGAAFLCAEFAIDGSSPSIDIRKLEETDMSDDLFDLNDAEVPNDREVAPPDLYWLRVEVQPGAVVDDHLLLAKNGYTST